MKVEVSLGEVVDKVTILELKLERLSRPEALDNVRRDLHGLRTAWAGAGLPQMSSLPQWSDLAAVNAELWEVEDALRACEHRQEFGEQFVALARSVYRLNDQRAALKRQIDRDLGSSLTEEKSYGS